MALFVNPQPQVPDQRKFRVSDQRDLIANNINFGATVAGFVSRGFPLTTNIDSFPFASAPATTSGVGFLTNAGQNSSGQSSAFYGYVSGYSSPTIRSDIIESFPFAASPTTSGSSIGALSRPKITTTGHSSATHGYASGGTVTVPSPDPLRTNGSINEIDKFPFASTPTTSTNVGTLTTTRSGAAGQSSMTHGYTAAGYNLSTALSTFVIDRFPFASSVTSVNIGNVSGPAALNRYGHSSMTHGYTAGGYNPTTAVYSSTIDRFPFASTGNAAGVGNLTAAKYYGASQSSVTHGYSAGGSNVVSPITAVERFSFASAPTSSAIISSLAIGKSINTGNEY